MNENSTRTGKIARLPAGVREELCRKLLDGRTGGEVLGWLNALPETKAMMRERFAGRPVNRQSLSQWRRGGYLDWRREQEARIAAQTLAGQARELASENGGPNKVAAVAGVLALVLAQTTQNLGEASKNPKERLDLVRTLTRGLVTLRRSTQQREIDQLAVMRKQMREELQRLQEEKRRFTERGGGENEEG